MRDSRTCAEVRLVDSLTPEEHRRLDELLAQGALEETPEPKTVAEANAQLDSVNINPAFFSNGGEALSAMQKEGLVTSDLIIGPRTFQPKMSETIQREEVKSEPIPIRFRSREGVYPGSIEVEGQFQVVAFRNYSRDNGLSEERSAAECKRCLRRDIENTIYGEVHAIAREMMNSYMDVIFHQFPTGMDAEMKLKGLIGKLMTYSPGDPK